MDSSVGVPMDESMTPSSATTADSVLHKKRKREQQQQPAGSSGSMDSTLSSSSSTAVDTAATNGRFSQEVSEPVTMTDAARDIMNYQRTNEAQQALIEKLTREVAQLRMMNAAASMTNLWIEECEHFPTVFDSEPATLRPKYLKELELCQLLGRLREKEEWWLKVQQPLIVNRWKSEMYEQATFLTPQTIEYGIQELKYQSQLYQQTSMKGHNILPSAIDGVYQNDQLISDELLQQLKECLKPFEEVPESERDYHPDQKVVNLVDYYHPVRPIPTVFNQPLFSPPVLLFSPDAASADASALVAANKQVINLVDPSLYCLRIGRTKLSKVPIPLNDTLRSIGSGAIVSRLRKSCACDSGSYKSKYVWLPAEFVVSSDGSKVTIASYINNLHPIQHQPLYGVLEEIFASFLPMFEKVLTDLRSPIPTRMDDKNYDRFKKSKVDPQTSLSFQSHLDGERESLKIASKGQATFYIDMFPDSNLSAERLLDSAQLCATIMVLSQVHPELKLSPQAKLRVIQYQDGLARVYLESTFEAYTKTEGLFTTDHTITSNTNFNQPPFLDFYGPGSQFPYFLRHARSETSSAVAKLVTDPVGGLLFKEKVARRWFVLFKRRLHKLYPSMDSTTREQFCQLFLQKEFVNLIRLCAVVEYLTVELLELGGNVTRDARPRRKTIELLDLHLAINRDSELVALDEYVQHRIFGSDTSLEINEAEIADEVAKMGEDGTTTTTTAAAFASGEDVKMALDENLAAIPLPKKPPPPLTRNCPFCHMDLQDVDHSGCNEEETTEDGEEVDEDEKEKHKKVYQPEVPFPFPPESRTAPNTNTISLAGRTLQVIVKLETIELTPEKPIYPGGEWHVEGMKNESIVASGIYYLKGTNITDSRLCFSVRTSELYRRRSSYDDDAEEEENVPYEVHGLERDGGIQQLGSVSTKDGRAIVFPNIYRHQVQPFQLADPTKPGQQQILSFFLVDPTIRVISTANVPPQQQHWLKTATGDQTPRVIADLYAHTSLCPDTIQLTTEYYSDLDVIDSVEANRVRDELLSERRFFS